MVYGQLLTAAAGFFLASGPLFDASILFAALVGLALVVASACVFNNYIDRDIDAKMQRTQGRGLVLGHVPLTHALIYGAILGAAGLKILILYTNLISAA